VTGSSWRSPPRASNNWQDAAELWRPHRHDGRPGPRQRRAGRDHPGPQQHRPGPCAWRRAGHRRAPDRASDNQGEFLYRLVLDASTPYLTTHVGRFVSWPTRFPGQAGSAGRTPVASSAVQLKWRRLWTHGPTSPMRSPPTSRPPSPARAQILLAQRHGNGPSVGDRSARRPGPAVLWGKATSNWHNAVWNGCYVDVTPAWTAAAAAWTPPDGPRLPARHGTAYDPNVVVNADHPLPDGRRGTAVCTGQYLVGPIGMSLRLWGGNPAADLEPAGRAGKWRPRSGQFPVIYKDGDSDYGTLAARAAIRAMDPPSRSTTTPTTTSPTRHTVPPPGTPYSKTDGYTTDPVAKYMTATSDGVTWNANPEADHAAHTDVGQPAAVSCDGAAGPRRHSAS